MRKRFSMIIIIFLRDNQETTLSREIQSRKAIIILIFLTLINVRE